MGMRSLREEVVSTLARFRERVREARAGDYEEIPHDELMRRWEIDETNRGTVLRNLRIVQVSFVLILVFSFFALPALARVSGMAAFFFFFALTITCAGYVLLYEWRIWTIKKRKPMIPFLVWLFR